MAQNKEMDLNSDTASIKYAIVVLIFLTLAVATGPLVFTVINDHKEHKENRNIDFPVYTLSGVKNFDENMIIMAFSGSQYLDSQQRSILKNRLADIQRDGQKSSGSVKSTCGECNQNVEKLLKKIEASDSDAARIKASSKRTSFWVFLITVFGTVFFLLMRMKKEHTKRGKKKNYAEVFLLCMEWSFPTLVQILTNPWVN